MYVEDLKRGTNKDMGPNDIFETGPTWNAGQGRTHCHPGLP